MASVKARMAPWHPKTKIAQFWRKNCPWHPKTKIVQFWIHFCFTSQTKIAQLWNKEWLSAHDIAFSFIRLHSSFRTWSPRILCNATFGCNLGLTLCFPNSSVSGALVVDDLPEPRYQDSLVSGVQEVLLGNPLIPFLVFSPPSRSMRWR